MNLTPFSFHYIPPFSFLSVIGHYAVQLLFVFTCRWNPPSTKRAGQNEKIEASAASSHSIHKLHITPAASPLTSRSLCSFQTAATLHLIPLTVWFAFVAFCHQFISEDPANCGFSFHYFVLLHSCILSVDACSPNLHIGNCTESKGPIHPSLVLGCIPPATIATYFTNSYT